MGPAWRRSRALPWGTPSMTSTSTTSPNSFSTAYCATVAPTLPAPTTVILGRRLTTLSGSAFPTCIPALLCLSAPLGRGGPRPPPARRSPHSLPPFPQVGLPHPEHITPPRPPL